MLYISNLSEQLEKKMLKSDRIVPPILYFGSVGLLGYDIYSNVFKEIEFLSLYIQTPLTVIFIYMTYLGLKKYQKKNSL